MKQSKINDFFNKEKSICNTDTISLKKNFDIKNNNDTTKIKKKKIKFIIKSYLKIDLEQAKKNLIMLPNMVEEMYNHYKEINDYKPMHLMKKHFDIFYEKEVLELVSLFERPIPYQRKYYRRLAKEFYLIKEKNFFEVFKQVKEILNMTTMYPHIIRGSAGCSLVCYLMKITDLDPLLLNINLTRFMHENRSDMPDIDIDFPAHDRNKIYEKIFSRWSGKVARISNHVLFKEKSALKEAIRESGYRKFLPKDFDLYKIFDDKKKIQDILKNARSKLGKFKNYSLHCGGIVIFKDKVPDDYFLQECSVYKNNDLIKGSQIKLNKDEVEDNGLIKIDILSNKGLSQLWDISKKKILDYDFNDSNIYEYLSKGENLGITYGESRGMRKIFVEMKPRNIHDIATALALIRPAAAKNGQKFTFLKDYHFTNKVERDKYVIYDDDAIEHISKLLRISNSEADIYRKAFSKNKFYKKKEFRDRLELAQPRMKIDDIDLIMDRLENLQSYSFCKSHAYSYAYLLYVLTFQKFYNPTKFWESTLKNCCTSYRKWTHFREAYNNGVDLKKYMKCDKNLSSEKQYFSQGFWIGNRFLNNMYIKFDKNIFNKEVKYDEEGNKIKNVIKTKFRGLIATYKIFKSCNKLSLKSKYITFVTIGYDNSKYIDLVLWGCQKLSKAHCIEGHGTYEDGHWIKVEKFNYSFIK